MGVIYNIQVFYEEGRGFFGWFLVFFWSPAYRFHSLSTQLQTLDGGGWVLFLIRLLRLLLFHRNDVTKERRNWSRGLFVCEGG